MPPNAYCWLDYHALYKTPLILSHSLSVNCSGIPMFDVCGRFTRVLKQKSNVKNVHIALRAVRFTRGLNPHKIMHKFESWAVYDGTQTCMADFGYKLLFESCAVYKWSQYGGYQQWKQNQFESCIVFKGFQSAQDNAQVCAQVLFTRPPTLIPFVPPSPLPFLTRNQ